MIQPQEFVEAARDRRFDWYAGVPCSFLTPLINYVLEDARLTYVAATNEGEAVAAGAGAVLGGRQAVVMMQNSGLGNAVNPLTSLTYTFRLPLLLVITWRGEPGRSDEPQHDLMGAITQRLLEDMEIPWALFPAEPGDLGAVLDRAVAHMREARRPFALLMRRGAVGPRALQPLEQKPKRTAPDIQESWVSPGTSRATRNEVLERVVAHTPEAGTVVVATTGFCGRELFALADRPNHFYMVGSMGCAASIGLGLSMARPDLRVVVVDGDGAALMRLGSAATVGAFAGPNLGHLVLDNEAYESTGGQATLSPGVRFAAIARACGYESVFEGDDPGVADRALSARPRSGPVFAHLKIQRGTRKNLPRPSQTPEQVAQRLMAHLGKR